MKRIYLVRHGESEANVALTHGTGESPLSEKGLEQAEFIAERASKLPVQRIISSTMVRAHDTAKIIGRKLGLPVETSDLFVESRGPSETIDTSYTDPKTIQAYEEIRQNYGKPGWRHSDEETFEDQMKRTQAALTFLLDLPEEHILVASHGLFLRLLMGYVVFGPTPTPREFQRVVWGFGTKNTGLSILEYQERYFDGMKLPNPWQVVTWNDHAHLAD
jgi:probable phosphoglycerate mutase